MPSAPAVRPSPLRPYQDAIVRATLECFKTERRAQVVAACGTGKTRMLMAVSEALAREDGGGVHLITEPTLLLIEQVLSDFRAHGDPALPIEVVAVCSDDGVTKDLPPHEVGCPATTNVEELAAVLAAPLVPGARRLVFATYQSMETVCAAVRQSGTPLRFVGVDEAHRTAGVGEESPFRLVLDDAKLPAERRLFVTATPREIEREAPTRGAGRGAGGAGTKGGARRGVRQREIFSMDDPRVYGEVVREITLREAIGEAIIADYRVVAVEVRQSEVLRHLDPATAAQGPFAGASEREVAAGLALQAAMVGFDLKHTITYHARKQSARRLADALRRAGAEGSGPAVHADTITGDTPIAERVGVLRAFRNESAGQREVVTSAKALTEGINVQCADGVLFADPKGSVIEVGQAIGRILRRAGPDDPKVGTVVIPLLVNDVGGAPVADAKSADELLTTLWTLKLLDPKVLERVFLYSPQTQEMEAVQLPKPEGRAGAAARARTARAAAADALVGCMEDVEPVTARPYHFVQWLPVTKRWRALVTLQNAAGVRRTVIDALFDDPEEAGHAVDLALNEAGLFGKAWPRNFGRVVLRRTRASQQAAGAAPEAPVIPGVTFLPELDRWEAKVGVHAQGKVKYVIRYADCQDDAVAARDTLVRKYQMFVPLHRPDGAPRYDLIASKQPSSTEPGVEFDAPTGWWWATARCDGHLCSLGFYESEAAAAAVARRAQTALARMQGRGLDYATLADVADTARALSGHTPLQIQKRAARTADGGGGADDEAVAARGPRSAGGPRRTA